VNLAEAATMTSPKKYYRPAAVCFLLTVTTLGAYWPVFGCRYINFDDPDYVTENLIVQQGLTRHGLAWAFSSSHASNWHPLTWMSHMLDCQFFDLNPAAHHSVSLLFHVLNAPLLFRLLRSMTEALWRSAVVAALLILVLSVAALRLAKRWPYLAIGWLWFLGTLVPVIGLVQVGMQSMADRYAYIPSVGLFLVLSWGGWELLQRLRAGPAAVMGLALCILAALGWQTAR
jgi:hypothetical protein